MFHRNPCYLFHIHLFGWFFSNWCIFSDSIILVVKFPKKIFRLHEMPHSSSELAYQAPGFGAAFRDHEWFCREFNTELPHFYTLLYPLTSPLSMCNFETWALYRCIQKNNKKNWPQDSMIVKFRNGPNIPIVHTKSVQIHIPRRLCKLLEPF